jgi:hypothetical protein
MNAAYLSLVLTAGGGTENIPVNNAYDFTLITGNATMSSSWTVQISGTPMAGHRERLQYRATMNFDGNNLTIFGKAIPAHLQALPFDVDAVYDGAAWKTSVKPAAIEAGSVAGTALVDATVDGDKMIDDSVDFTKLEPLAQGSVLVGDGSNNAAAVDASADGAILIGDGNDVNAVVVSGDIAIDNAGVVTIPDGTITPAMLSTALNVELFKAEVDLSQGDIATLNSVPVSFLSSGGANVAYSIAGVAAKLNYDAPAFTFAASLQIQTDDGGVLAEIANTNLNNAGNVVWFTPEVAAERDLELNRGLQVAAETSEPGGGGADATISLHIYYYEHTF